MYGWNSSDNTIQVWSAQNRYTSYFINDRIYLRDRDNGLFKLESGQLIQVPADNFFKSGLTIDNMIGLNDGSIIFSSISQFYKLKDQKVTPFTTAADTFFKNTIITSGALHVGKNILVPTRDGIYLLNESGKLINKIESYEFPINYEVTGSFKDQTGNIWFSMVDGISLIEMTSPFTKFTEREGLIGKVNDLILFNNEYYAATATGVSIYNNSVKRFVSNNLLNFETSYLIEIDSSLYAGSILGLHQLIDRKFVSVADKASNTIVKSKLPNMYYSGQFLGLNYMTKELIEKRVRRRVGRTRRFRTFITTEIKWKVETETRINDNVINLNLDKKNRLWIDTKSSGIVLAFLNDSTGRVETVRRFNKSTGLEDEFLSTFIFMDTIYSSSRTQLYQFDEQKNDFKLAVNLSSRLNQHISNIYQFNTNEMISISDGQLFSFDPTDYKVKKNPFKRIDDHTFDGFYKESNTVFWVYGSEGLFSYNKGKDQFISNRYKVLIRRVVLNRDSLIYSSGLQNSFVDSEFDYQQNTLGFYFSAPSYYNNDEIFFSYYLEGNENSWTNWDKQNSVTYSNLPDGEYHFFVKAKDIYGIEYKSSSLAFSILSPFWKTWWFILFEIIIAIGLIYLLVQFRIKKIKEQNEYLESLVNKRTTELNRKNEALNDTLAKLKETQTHPIQAEKMSSLGQMIAGVAHEMNTPLGYVKNNVHLLGRMLGDFFEQKVKLTKKEMGSKTDQFKAMLDDAINGINRLAELVKGLRNFSRIDELKLTETDLISCIEDTLTIVQSIINDYKITIKKEYKAPVKLFCNAAQLNQLFMNVIKNACQAMYEHNKDTKTKSVLLIKVEDLDDKVTITIKDNGGGIEEDVVEKIFDPFFTTKELGQGTGLGLAIAYKVVEEHKGTIRVDVEEEVGTAFIVDLPKQDATST